jgi:hypothetical protein
MKTDVPTQIRIYAEYVDALVSDWDVADVVAGKIDAVAKTGGVPPQVNKWRGPIAALAIMALVLAVGGLTVLLRSPDAIDPLAPIQTEGEWTRTILEPGFIAEDLASTSHGLVAAAGQDGVWVSSDGGTSWRQTLVVPYEVPALNWDGELPKVSTDVQTVVEFKGALYAIGTVWLDPDGDQFEKRTTAWRSEDGEVWSESLIDNSEDHLQVIEAVSNDSQILLITRVVGDVEDGSPAVRTVILRSTTGSEWTRLETSGLSHVLFAVSTYEDGYVALAEHSRIQRGAAAVLASRDGVEWTEVAPWTVAAPDQGRLDVNISVWPMVDLFETPSGLVVVGVAGSEPEGPMPEEGLRPTVMLATSTDGREFNVDDTFLTLFETRSCGFELEDQRGCAWPPVQPPEGAAIDDQLILLGHSYPDDTTEAIHYQWIRSGFNK